MQHPGAATCLMREQLEAEMLEVEGRDGISDSQTGNSFVVKIFMNTAITAFFSNVSTSLHDTTRAHFISRNVSCSITHSLL